MCLKNGKVAYECGRKYPKWSSVRKHSCGCLSLFTKFRLYDNIYDKEGNSELYYLCLGPINNYYGVISIYGVW